MTPVTETPNPSSARRSRAAVVIPIYQRRLSPAERHSVDTTIAKLRRHDIVLIGPHSLEPELQRLAADYRPTAVAVRTYRDEYFSGIPGYNALMRSRAFYKSFADHRFMLIAQTDALVISDELDAWCDKDYSYVGAPWFVGLNKPRRPLALMAAGNGGFSLRKVDDFIRVLSVPRYVPNLIFSGEHDNSPLVRAAQIVKHKLVFAYNFPPLFAAINEDFFWGWLVPRSCRFFRVADAKESCAFAFEREPRFLFELNGRQLPFGCHGWEKYDPGFWRSVMRLP